MDIRCDKKTFEELSGMIRHKSKRYSSTKVAQVAEDKPLVFTEDEYLSQDLKKIEELV